MQIASFSLRRFLALAVKELIQMKRDKLTFAMMFGIPLIQLMLFGFAINNNPKELPTGVVLADTGPEVRAFLWSLRNSGYFRIEKTVSAAEGDLELARGNLQFLVSIPPGFTRQLHRDERPSILVEADASDPAATGNAISALRELATRAFHEDFKGALGYLTRPGSAVNLVTHLKYNPEIVTQFNIVPGLMGVVLTMTMVVITALAMTRERERGTIENLLSMPVRPFEVLLGKIVPYIMVGFTQVVVILLAAYFVFSVPFVGNVLWVFLAAFIFIVANLAMGVTFSTIARNQLQAMQMSFFFFLPSLLLSGFMFPFRGMPQWAQFLGQLLPLTYFLRIVRGVLLKGNGLVDIMPNLWPIALFASAALALGIYRYRQTLD